MQPPGCSTLYAGAGGTSGCYPPFYQSLYSVAPPQPPADPQNEPSVQTCVRDSVRLLGEAVAVLEGVRLLGSQLLQWAGELHHVLSSFVPAALLLQLLRWIRRRAFGASKRRTINRMSRVWQEASGGLVRPSARLLMPTNNNRSRGVLGGYGAPNKRRGWLVFLRDLSVFLALIFVAAELYIHFYVYR